MLNVQRWQVRYREKILCFNYVLYGWYIDFEKNEEKYVDIKISKWQTDHLTILLTFYFWFDCKYTKWEDMGGSKKVSVW